VIEESLVYEVRRNFVKAKWYPRERASCRKKKIIEKL